MKFKAKKLHLALAAFTTLLATPLLIGAAAHAEETNSAVCPMAQFSATESLLAEVELFFSSNSNQAGTFNSTHTLSGQTFYELISKRDGKIRSASNPHGTITFSFFGHNIEKDDFGFFISGKSTYGLPQELEITAYNKINGVASPQWLGLVADLERSYGRQYSLLILSKTHIDFHRVQLANDEVSIEVDAEILKITKNSQHLDDEGRSSKTTQVVTFTKSLDEHGDLKISEIKITESTAGNGPQEEKRLTLLAQ